MSEEIESRLEISSALKQYVRHELGEDIFRIAYAMAASLSHIEDWRCNSWIDDQKTFDLFQATTSNLIRNYRDLATKADGRSTPNGSFDDKSPEKLGEMFAALGGLAPPRPRKPVPAAEPTDEELRDRSRSRANMRRQLEERTDKED